MKSSSKWITAEEVIKNAKNIAFYGRVSTKDQEIDSQQTAIVKRYLERFEKDIANGYDGDVRSAYSKPYTERKDLLKLLAALESGKYDALIVSDRDRLSRQTEEHSLLREKFNELGIPVVIASKNDLYNTESFLKDLIEDALTKMESDNISVRTKATLRTMLQKDMYIGGHPPFGYRMVRSSETGIPAFEGNMDELLIVEEIFSDYMQGEVFTVITNKLKEKYKGTKWSVTKVKSIILNPIYAGVLFYNRYEYKGTKRAFKPIDQWKALPPESLVVDFKVISLEEWWFCWQKFELQKDKPPRYFNTSFYLNDLISCSCGTDEKLVGKDWRTNIKKTKGKWHGHRWYFCKACKVKFQADDLHTKFFDLLFRMPRPDDLILREMKQAIQKRMKTIEINLYKFNKRINAEEKGLNLIKEYEPDYKAEDLLLKELKEEVIAFYLTKMHSEEVIKNTEKQIRILEHQAARLQKLIENDDVLEKIIADQFTTPNWEHLSGNVLRNIALFIVEKCTVLNGQELWLKIKSLSPELLTLKR
ncbi:MAG: recombinase family protein [Bacillaceae bacterium]